MLKDPARSLPPAIRDPQFLALQEKVEAAGREAAGAASATSDRQTPKRQPGGVPQDGSTAATASPVRQQTPEPATVQQAAAGFRRQPGRHLENQRGELTVHHAGNRVSGTYTGDGGEIVGELHGDVLHGYWIENSSGVRCATAKNGRHYWGRIRWLFDGNAFTGARSSCDKPVPDSGNGWTGQRISAPLPAPSATGPGRALAGEWKTSEGVLTLRQSGSRLSGSFTNDGGAIVGELHGKVLDGNWTENHASVRCSTPMNGRHHWGRIRWVYDGNTFAGAWSYCDKPVPNSGNRWTGAFIGPTPAPGTAPAARATSAKDDPGCQNDKPNLSGDCKFPASWVSVLSLTQTGDGKLTGTYGSGHKNSLTGKIVECRRVDDGLQPGEALRQHRVNGATALDA